MPTPPERWVTPIGSLATKLPRNFFQARRADTRIAGGDSHRWGKGRAFFTPPSPGPVGPGTKLCRPFGAGVLGKPAACCCNLGSSNLLPGPEGRHNDCRWQQPPVGDRKNLFHSSLPGVGTLDKQPVSCCSGTHRDLTNHLKI